MTEPTLGDASLPGLFQAADSASLEGQKSYISASRMRLILVVAAAVFASFSFETDFGLDLAAIAVALVFVAAVLVELWQLQEKPGSAWYDGRALAESTKTLAWRYSVRAIPFEVDDSLSRTNLLSALRDLSSDLSELSMSPTEAPPISDAMIALRSSDLATRKKVYLRDRLQEQKNWYRGKATFNRQRGRRWRTSLVGAELLGVVAALLKAFGVVDFDIPGIVAAAIGAGAAWLAIRQHDSNAKAYALAAEELSIAEKELEAIYDEAAWSASVSDAEEAISREHTMWRASRSSPSLVRALNKLDRKNR